MREDEIIWHLHPKGQFSVKSAYRLGRTLKQNEEASTSSSKHTEILWKCYWKSKLPPKIKLCGWKIYNNIIPTLSNLINKRMNINPICFMCRKKMETVEHLFWECKFAKGIWANYFSSNNLVCLDGRMGWSTKDYCKKFWNADGGDRVEEKSLKTSLVICWQIW